MNQRKKTEGNNTQQVRSNMSIDHRTEKKREKAGERLNS